jgi:ketosteroid isomerase-like protein
MTSRRLGLTVIAASLLSLGSAAADPADADVKAAYAAWDAAFNEGAPDKVAAAYAADSVFLPATHDVIKGPAGVRDFFAGLFGAGVKGHRLELLETRSQGDLVVAAAKWSATGKDAAGADQPWGGVATHVFARQPDGSLKLVLHTFN